MLGIIYLQWEEKVERLPSMIEVERAVEALLKFLAFPIDNFLMVRGYGIKVAAVMGLHRVPQKNELSILRIFHFSYMQ
jgi:hypothetical protein